MPPTIASSSPMESSRFAKLSLLGSVIFSFSFVRTTRRKGSERTLQSGLRRVFARLYPMRATEGSGAAARERGVILGRVDHVYAARDRVYFALEPVPD